MAHTDGPAYQSNIAILSMRDSVKFSFTPRDVDARCGFRESLILLPHSLVLFRHDACVDFMHGISEDIEDVVDDTVVNLEAAGVTVGRVIPRKTTRYSITIRRALFPTDEASGILTVASCSQSPKSYVRGSDWETVVTTNASKLATIIGRIVVCHSAVDAGQPRPFLGVPAHALVYSFEFIPSRMEQWVNWTEIATTSEAKVHGRSFAGSICCLKCLVTLADDTVIVTCATDVLRSFGDVPYEISLWF
jgi:hypothetical protein